MVKLSKAFKYRSCNGFIVSSFKKYKSILKLRKNTKFGIELNDKKALIVGYGGVGTCWQRKLIVLECKLMC